MSDLFLGPGPVDRAGVLFDPMRQRWRPGWRGARCPWVVWNYGVSLLPLNQYWPWGAGAGLCTVPATGCAVQAGLTVCGTPSPVGLCPQIAEILPQETSEGNASLCCSPSGPEMSFGGSSVPGRCSCCCWFLPEAQSGILHERNRIGMCQRRRDGHVLVPGTDSPKYKQTKVATVAKTHILHDCCVY